MGFIKNSWFTAAYFAILSIIFFTFFLKKILYIISIVKNKSLEKQCTHTKKSGLSALILIASLVVCIFNHFWLSKAFYPFSLITDIIMLYCLILLVRNIKVIRQKRLFITFFILFFVLVSIFEIIASSQIKPLSIDEVASLPYILWTKEKVENKKSGVTIYNPKLSFPGVNFFISMESIDSKTSAYLLDMRGNPVHQWTPKSSHLNGWGVSIISDDNSLLCIERTAKGIFKLDSDSNVLWRKKIPAHHDIRIAKNKDIYALTKRVVMVSLYGIPVPIINDYITILSSSGEIKKEIDLFPLFKNKLSFNRRAEIFKVYSLLAKLSNAMEIILNNKIKDYVLTLDHDIFHTNSLQIIDKDIPGLCKKGAILISVHNLNLIAILDKKMKEIVWSWGEDDLDRPHHPTLLENGNILIFDNGSHRKYSRVIEVDPLTKKIIWQYPSPPSKDFFSDTQGSCQRLPNGNTLITESLKSRVIEVTKKGEIVWEFYHPFKNSMGQRLTIYRMLRIPNAEKHITTKN